MFCFYVWGISFLIDETLCCWSGRSKCFAGWIANKTQALKATMLCGTLLSIIISCLLIFSHQLTLLKCYVLFFGLGFCSSVQALGYTFTGENNDVGHRASSLGLVSMLSLFGWVVFQPLFAWIMQFGWRGEMINGLPIYSVVNYRYALLILPLAFIVGIIFLTSSTK